MGGLRGIDMFRKIPADLTSATTTGAILSVAAYRRRHVHDRRFDRRRRAQGPQGGEAALRRPAAGAAIPSERESKPRRFIRYLKYGSKQDVFKFTQGLVSYDASWLRQRAAQPGRTLVFA